MTNKLVFDIVSIVSMLLPSLFALILVALPRPRSTFGRSVSAIVVAWIASVAYTIYLYNPAGIAAGRELGWDSPEMRFDNNTIASQLIGGWIYPALVVALFLTVRHFRKKTSSGEHE
jgi:hypothetical protein